MTAAEFLSLGDALWLDFVNTARARGEPADDRLASAEAYARWLLAQRLDATDAEAQFADALRLRDRLLAVAEALDAGHPAPPGAVEAINEQLRAAAGHSRLTRVGGAWRLEFAPTRALAPLEAVARSAAESLAAPGLGVRSCRGEGCTLFFADTSVNQGRLFCCAATCGRTRSVERRRRSLR
jgi:predicted RNA-binding Zn ribbon-like protein